MAISTQCPGCQTLFRLPDELAGKHVRCQKCSHMLTVPGVLAPPAKAPPPRPATVVAPPPVAPPVAAPPPQAPPRAAEPAPAEPLTLSDGIPGVVLVEVPVKPAPRPLPEATEPPRSAPASTPRSGPTMTLSSRERPRRTNRPRHPSSALAGLSVGAMLLVFVGLLGASGAAWIWAEASTPRPPIVFNNFNNGFPKGGPMVFQPNPPIQGGGPMMGLAQGQGDPDNGGRGSPQVFNPRPDGPKFNDQRATRVKLQNGQVEVRQQLTNNDPRDPVQRWKPPHSLLPCKVFLVELEQGKRYVIDMQNLQKPINNFQANVNDFDPYLRVESLDGKRLVEDDDVAHAQLTDARVELHPPQTATYRIFCTLFDRNLMPGQGQFQLLIRERPVAPPAAANVALPKPSKAKDQFSVTPATDKDLQVRVLRRRQGGALRSLNDLCWSADGQSVFMLDEHGVLAKLRSDGLAEEGLLSLGRRPGGLALSSQGLVVTLPPPPGNVPMPAMPAMPPLPGQALAPPAIVNRPIVAGTREVWLIDPDNLQVKARFGAFLRSERGSAGVVSAPGLPYAFVASTGETSSYPAGHGVLVLDLRDSRKPGRFYDLPNTALAVSPRGDYLFTMEGDVLTSYAINAETGELTLKRTSHPYTREGNANYRIDFSPDGQHVCAGGANLPAALQRDHPKWQPRNVPVYAVDDLRTPLFAIDTNLPVRAVGLDIARANRVLTQTIDAPIVVFDRAGQRRANYRPPEIGNDQNALQFLVHPAGNQVLIRFEDRLCLATFKADAGPVVVRNRDPNLPQPMALKDGESIADEPKKSADMTWRELQLPNLGEIDPVWDADGKALFHLDTDGVLTRYRAGNFTATDRLALGRAAKAMALSAQGLVVALRDQPELWVIEPQSLRVVRTIGCPAPVRYLACQPKQDRAVAVGNEVLLVDLKQGKVLARGLQPHEDAGLPFQRPTLTPDGRYVLLAHSSGGAAKVLRVKVEADRLVVDEVRGTAAKGAHAFCLSAGGKHVAWYSVYGKGKQHPVEFYAIDNWKVPISVLPVSARAMAPAADGTVYVQTTDFELRRLAQEGAKDGALLRWDEGRVGLREIAAQPERPEALIVSLGTRVLYAERAAK